MQCRGGAPHCRVTTQRQRPPADVTAPDAGDTTARAARNNPTGRAHHHVPMQRGDTLEVTLEEPPLPPNLGYIDFQGLRHYYKIHEKSSSWEEAKQICEIEDAHLLVLNSDAEADVIRQAVKKYTSTSNFYFWIGAHDKDIEGKYVTIFGETLAAAGYERWRSGQPTNTNKENCLLVHGATMELWDEPCKGLYSFVCEQVIE